MDCWIRINEGIFKLVCATVINNNQVLISYKFDENNVESTRLKDPNGVLNAIHGALNSNHVAVLCNFQKD